jgi:putative membrane protein
MTTESFVKKVAGDNQMEIDLARMASSRAKSTQVKDYAQQLIKDHTSSLDALKKYASKHNMSLRSGSTASSSNTQSNRNDTAGRSSQPEAMARTDDASSRELASKTGAEFDRAYIHLMVQNHEKGVALFEKQKEGKGMDSEIQAFVNNTLPVLRRHLSPAESIEKTVGSATIDSHPTTNPSNTNPSNTNPTKTRQ